MFVASHDPRMLIFLGVFCLCYGGYHVYLGETAGALRRVTAAELEEGKAAAAEGTWFEIVGVLRWDLQMAGIVALLVYRPVMWVMRRSEPKRHVIEVRRGAGNVSKVHHE